MGMLSCSDSFHTVLFIAHLALISFYYSFGFLSISFELLIFKQ